MNETISFNMRDAGSIDVSHNSTNEHVHSLLGIGQRKNPKRPFLFVSKVLGKHVPVKPEVMNNSYDDLATQVLEVLTDDKVTCIGMAETAVGLAAGVHNKLRLSGVDSLYISSTRYPDANYDVFCEFKEDHSHATSHFLHYPAKNELKKHLIETETLVLIDDESSTGNTFMNLIKSLVDSGLSGVKRVITVSLTDWSDSALEDLMKKNSKTKNLELKSVSLVSGKYTLNEIKLLEEDLERHAEKIKKNEVVADLRHSDLPFNECRLGMKDSSYLVDKSLLKAVSGRILVLGTGEYTWQPYLVAKELEDNGFDVLFSTTTRSPAYVFGELKTKCELKDNYGEGVDMFSYNLNPDDYDCVLICSETKNSMFDQSFVEIFKNSKVLLC